MKGAQMQSRGSKKPSEVRLFALGQIEKNAKGEFLASIPALKLMDVGDSPSEAIHNLDRHLGIFFQTLLSEGTLEEELEACGLYFERQGSVMEIFDRPQSVMKRSVQLLKKFHDQSKQKEFERWQDFRAPSRGWVPLDRPQGSSRPPESYAVEERVLVGR